MNRKNVLLKHKHNKILMFVDTYILIINGINGKAKLYKRPLEKKASGIKV